MRKQIRTMELPTRARTARQRRKPWRAERSFVEGVRFFGITSYKLVTVLWRGSDCGSSGYSTFSTKVLGIARAAECDAAGRDPPILPAKHARKMSPIPGDFHPKKTPPFY